MCGAPERIRLFDAWNPRPDARRNARYDGRFRMQRIHLIATGGTLEKIYSEQRGSVENVDSKIETYLARLRLPDTQVDVTRLMNKDSLEMTDADRQRVLEAVLSKRD